MHDDCLERDLAFQLNDWLGQNEVECKKSPFTKKLKSQLRGNCQKEVPFKIKNYA